MLAAAQGKRGIIVPAENAAEAAVVDGIDVIGVKYLTEAVGFLTDEQTRLVAVQSAVPESPKNVLRLIATNAHVERTVWRPILVPTVLKTFQTGGDGVADEDEIDIALHLLDIGLDGRNTTLPGP